MQCYLLDAGGAGLLIGLALIFVIITVIVEGVTLLLLKYNTAGKSFLDAFVINLVSIIAGYLLSSVWPGIFNLERDVFYNYFILYAITVLIEFAILAMMNKGKPAGKTLTAALVINLVSYLVLFAFSFF